MRFGLPLLVSTCVFGIDCADLGWPHISRSTGSRDLVLKALVCAVDWAGGRRSLVLCGGQAVGSSGDAIH